MIKIKNSRRGFTLVELGIYMGLMATALVVLTEIFLSVLDSQLESTATSNVDQDGKFILMRLRYDIARASAISQPSSLGSATGSALLVIGGVNYIYSASPSGEMSIVNNFGTDNLTGYGSSISGLLFTRLGNVGGKNDLQVKFRLTSRTKRQAGQEIKDFQTTEGTR